MAKQFSVERGLAIASHLSLLPADKLPSTAPYGSMSAVLANIQLALKQGDEGLWYGVMPNTIDTWIRKLETVSEQYRSQELKGEYSGIDKAICKGTWEYSQYADMGRYLLRIGAILLKAKDQKVKDQQKERFEKAKHIERKRSIESASLKASKKSTSSSVPHTLLRVRILF